MLMRLGGGSLVKPLVLAVRNTTSARHQLTILST
jgi:hypothetical protein